MKASVSGDRKALRVVVVGRLIDAFDEEIASVAAASAATYLPALVIKRLPAGFVMPAQPVVASRPPSGANWVHEIKHDGYRLIVRQDGPTVRLYTRSAHDCTARLPAIAAAAEQEQGEELYDRWRGGRAGTSHGLGPKQKHLRRLKFQLNWDERKSPKLGQR
jgi:hypothetical protein